MSIVGFSVFKPFDHPEERMSKSINLMSGVNVILRERYKHTRDNSVMRIPIELSKSLKVVLSGPPIIKIPNIIHLLSILLDIA